MKKDDSVYLRHILDAIRLIRDYLQDVSSEQFRNSLFHQDAVVRRLQIIGEAARSVSPECRQAHPEVPWNEIVGMRNRIIHEYVSIDLDIVWEVIDTDLPDLEDHIKGILGAV
jgi:uncharacterized protein with HEPN domain